MKIHTACGFTLLELMVALLLLGLVTSMIGSVLRVSIDFTGKGEERLFSLEREQSFLELLHRQVLTARVDERRRRVEMTAETDLLSVVTRSPLLYPQGGLVLAVYQYDPDTQSLYYTEKRDFYNVDYQEGYRPDPEEMIYLLHLDEPPDFSFAQETGALTFTYGDREYTFHPRSNWRPEQI